MSLLCQSALYKVSYVARMCQLYDTLLLSKRDSVPSTSAILIPMRIALFGGSFDPPHRGHLAIARAAADAFALDRVLFAPAAQQPLKRDQQGAGYADRLAMVSLACSDDARFEASELDGPRPDGRPNYSLWTLESLSRLYPTATLFNLAGADSFRTMGKWHEPRRLLALAEWIVVSRPGIPLTGPDGSIADPERLILSPEERARIHLLDSVHEEVSATLLRERLEAGEPCADLLPQQVAAFIRAKHLYRTTRFSSE